MRSCGWTPVVGIGVLIRRGHQDRHTRKDSHAIIQGEGGHLHAQERGLGRDQPCPPWVSAPSLQDPEKRISVQKPPGLWCFVTAARLTHALGSRARHPSGLDLWALYLQMPRIHTHYQKS